VKSALGPQGVLANAGRGAIFADTRTVSPEVSAEIDPQAAAHGVAYLAHAISGNAASAGAATSPCSFRDRRPHGAP